jgi:hypothetical protein
VPLPSLTAAGCCCWLLLLLLPPAGMIARNLYMMGVGNMLYV